jgi:hypothetical protein
LRWSSLIAAFGIGATTGLVDQFAMEGRLI